MEEQSRPLAIVHNLPSHPTTFIGRVNEVAEIKDLLADRACRLLTLIGPGGIGKTRLAIQAATEMLEAPGQSALSNRMAPVADDGPEKPGRTVDETQVSRDVGFTHGVYFVALQPIQSFDFLVSAVADAINVPLTGQEDPVVQLLNYLHDKQMLLLLDNFEHLLAPSLSIPQGEAEHSMSPPEGEGAAAVDLLSDMLTVAPGMKLLVTSREVLNLQEEWLYHVQGLSFPTSPQTPLLLEEEQGEGLEAYSAVQLFVERACRVRRDFSLAEEGADVVRICQLIEGMPLAIELAASWTKTIPCAVITREIERNINFLATSLRNVPDRQRSMRAIFDQSWQLLTPQEQGAFRRLSVFQGSFDRDAAERITGASLATLSALVDKSLLRLDPNGRYQIHELLRQYAALQLAQSPKDIARVYDLHCAHYADFLHKRQEDMAGARQREATTEIKTELGNVRAAWQWAVGLVKVEEMQKAAQTLSWFYQFQSRYLEAANAFEKAVHSLMREAAPAQADLTLATILVELAWFYIRLGRLDQAEEMIAQSRAIYRRLEVPPVPGQATDPLLPLGIIASIRGDYVTAARLGEEARRVSEAHNHQGNLPFAFYVLARASLAKGDFESARQYAQQACAIVERANESWFMAYCLNELGNIASALGDYAEAEQHYQTSYTIRKAFDDPEGMAVALNHLGKIAILQGNYAEAEQLYQQSLAVYQQINDRGGLATSLNGLGTAACAMRDYQRACQHLRQALQIAMDIQYIPLILSILIGVGQLLLRTGQQERGTELLALTRHHPASDRETRDRAQEWLDRYQAELASELFAAAVQRGQNSDLEVVTTALPAVLTAAEIGLQVTPPAKGRRSYPSDQPLAEPLTPRELEVLQLIADGLSNQQIAEELVISVGTVKFYTSQIYGKLSVGSRTQAVARARDLNLLS